MRLATLILLGLLVGCSSRPAEPLPVIAPTPQPIAQAVTSAEHNHERYQLSGSLLTPPAGSLIELALLLVDEKGRPKALLGSNTLTGNGQPLDFSLGFSSDLLPSGLRPQLRARVSLSGQLIQRLPGTSIPTLQTQDLGALQLVSAP